MPQQSSSKGVWGKLQTRSDENPALVDDVPIEVLAPFFDKFNKVDRDNAALANPHFRTVVRDVTKAICVKNRAELQQALKIYPNVEHIRASDLQDRDLAGLKNFNKLQTLDLKECYRITAAGLSNLPSGLRNLALAALHSSGPLYIAQLMRFTELESLKITDYVWSDTGFNDDDLKTISTLSNLHTLGLKGFNCITDAGLGYLTALSSLENLTVNMWTVGSPQLTKSSLQVIGQFTNLRALTFLGFEDVTDDDLSELATLTSLRELDMSACRRINGSGLQHLADLKELTKLKLVCTDFDDAAITHLQQLPALTELVVCSCSKFTGGGFKDVEEPLGLKVLDMDSCAPVSDEGLEHICKMSDLEVLNINATACGPQGLHPLSQLKQLTSLLVSDNRHAGTGNVMLQLAQLLWNGNELGAGNVMAQLAQLRELRKLSLHNWPQLGTGSNDLKPLNLLTKLEEIHFGSLPEIHDADLQFLLNMPSLHTLSLGYCPGILGTVLPHHAQLKKLSLMYCDINDAGLENVGHCTSLQYLEISCNPKVTDTGLEHLLNLKNLESLYISGCPKLTIKHVAAFKKKQIRNLSISIVNQATEVMNR